MSSEVLPEEKCVLVVFFFNLSLMNEPYLEI